MEKVSLPKSTKKVHYQIFKGTTLVDIAVLLIFIGLGIGFSCLITINIICKFIIGLIIIGIGLLSIQKLKNETRAYEIIVRAIKYFAPGFNEKKMALKPDFELINDKSILKFKYLKSNLFMAGIKIEAINLTLLNDQQQTNLIADFADLLRIITIPCKIIKTNENYDFQIQIDNLQSQRKTNHSTSYRELIDLQIEQLTAIQTTTFLTLPMVYIIFCSDNQENTLSQLQSVINSSSFSSLSIKQISQSNLSNIWNKFTFNHEQLKTNSSKFKTAEMQKQGFIRTINDLPKQINYFWLNKLFNLSNVNICINLNPINKQQAKKQLDSAINKIKTNEQYALTPSQKSESQQYYDAFCQQQQAVIDDIDVLKDTSIFTTMFKEGGLYKELTKRLIEKIGIATNNNFISTKLTFTNYILLNLIKGYFNCPLFLTSS